MTAHVETLLVDCYEAEYTAIATAGDLGIGGELLATLTKCSTLSSQPSLTMEKLEMEYPKISIDAYQLLDALAVRHRELFTIEHLQVLVALMGI